MPTAKCLNTEEQYQILIRMAWIHMTTYVQKVASAIKSICNRSMIQDVITDQSNAVSFEICHSQYAVESADAYQIPQKAVRPPDVKYLAVGNGLHCAFKIFKEVC